MAENRVQKFFNATFGKPEPKEAKHFPDMPREGRIEGPDIPEAMTKLLCQVCGFLLADGEIEIAMNRAEHKDGRQRLTLQITINGSPVNVDGLVKFVDGGGNAG